MLEESLVQQYKDVGYILIPDAVPASVLQQMQSVTQQLIEKSRTVTHSNEVYDLGQSHAAHAPRLNRIKTPHKVDTVFDQYMRSDDFLSLVTPLLGSSVRLHNSKLNSKPANGGSAVEWHQDWAFYPHTNDDLLAVGIMLSDVGDDDGPLQCVPGSHRQTTLDHSRDGVFCGAIDPADPQARLTEADTLTGSAGSISIHHVRTLHGSAPNRGEQPRLMLFYELGAADAWPIAGVQSAYSGMSPGQLWDHFQATLICGEQSHFPRVETTPIRMPVPPPHDTSSIFQVQASGGAVSAFK